MIAAALFLVLGLGAAVALRVAGRTRLAAIAGFAVGIVFLGFGALIAYGFLFGD